MKFTDKNRNKIFISFLIIFLVISNFQILNVHATQHNFGYETLGTAGQRTIENIIAGSVFTINENGIADSITVGLKWITSAWTGKVKCAIYQHAQNPTLVSSTEERTIALTSTATWYVFNFNTPKPNLVSGTDYVLVVWGQSKVGTATVVYNVGVALQGHYGIYNYDYLLGIFPNPWLGLTHETRVYSIYCTYTVSEAKEWFLSEKWLIQLHNFGWFNVENWLLYLHNFSWFNVESWLMQLHSYSWFNVEIWLLYLHNYDWFNVENWLIQLHNYSWFLSENWLIQLHNFSWFDIESWKLGISSFIWNLAEIWKINIYSYNWFISEIWKLSIYPFSWFNVETWQLNIRNLIWNLAETWKINIGTVFWYIAETWSMINLFQETSFLLYAILIIMVSLAVVILYLIDKRLFK